MIKIFKDKDLKQLSYILSDSNEALIIDPKRDIGKYVNYLKKHSLKLKYIINTHPHADFISGDLELKKIFKDAEIFDFEEREEKLGNLTIKTIKTPGHTPYCISCIVKEKVDRFIFTGDFLMVSDMGRIDLLGEENIQNLYEMFIKSAEKLWKLDDGVIVFPAHYKGSFCAKELNENFITTIGIEKKTNRIFSNIHSQDAKTLIKTSFEKPLFASKLPKFNLAKKRPSKKCKKVSVIVDLRKPEKFIKKHVKNSINIYEKANLPYILGSLVEIDECIGLIGDKKTNFKKAVKRLKNVGFDKIKILGNIKHFKTVPFKRYKTKMYLDKVHLPKLLKYKDKKISFYCENGYKALAAESFLRRLNEDNS